LKALVQELRQRLHVLSDATSPIANGGTSRSTMNGGNLIETKEPSTWAATPKPTPRGSPLRLASRPAAPDCRAKLAELVSTAKLKNIELQAELICFEHELDVLAEVRQGLQQRLENGKRGP